jgi:hypothetical protein
VAGAHACCRVGTSHQLLSACHCSESIMCLLWDDLAVVLRAMCHTPSMHSLRDVLADACRFDDALAGLHTFAADVSYMALDARLYQLACMPACFSFLTLLPCSCSTSSLQHTVDMRSSCYNLCLLLSSDLAHWCNDVPCPALRQLRFIIVCCADHVYCACVHQLLHLQRMHHVSCHSPTILLIICSAAEYIKE